MHVPKITVGERRVPDELLFSEVTDWPGLDQLQCHSCFKISGPAGWTGLAGRFSPRIRALSVCIVLAWIQQCGFCDSCVHIGHSCSPAPLSGLQVSV